MALVGSQLPDIGAQSLTYLYVIIDSPPSRSTLENTPVSLFAAETVNGRMRIAPIFADAKIYCADVGSCDVVFNSVVSLISLSLPTPVSYTHLTLPTIYSV